MLNIGVDLGGTNIACAIVDEKGQIVERAKTPTLAKRENTEIINDIVRLCKELMAKINIKDEDINSIGVGSPGIVNADEGVVIYNNNLGFRYTNIRDGIKKHIDTKVYVGNDANVAAYGEYVFGTGKGYKDFVAITLGTGVGSGIILDGRIIDGSFHGGSELGHMVIKAGGVPCTCGRRGCWESYSSATGLIRKAREEAMKDTNCSLYKAVNGDMSKMNAKIPFDLADNGDAKCVSIINEYYDYLASGIVNVINILQPEIIVIGGGIAGQGKKLIDNLEIRIKEELYAGEEMLQTKIRIASLGNDAGIIGAAMLYRQYL